MYPPLYPPRLTLGSATLFNPDVGLDVPRSHCAPFVIALKFAHVFFRRCTSSLWASLPSSFLGLFLHTCRHLIRLFWECVFFLPPTAFHVIFSLVGRLPLFIFSVYPFCKWKNRSNRSFSSFRGFGRPTKGRFPLCVYAAGSDDQCQSRWPPSLSFIWEVNK